MYVRVSWGSLRPGNWEEYERYYNERVVPSTSGVHGLRERQLWRGTEDPDEGMSYSVWDTLGDLHDYERSETRRELLQEVEHLHRPWSYARGEYWVKHFEVVGSFGA